METVTEILNRTGKASTGEIAAILKIDRRDAQALLNELLEAGVVEKGGAHWTLTEAAPAPGGSRPLRLVLSSPDDVQEFPTLGWVRQRRKELRNEMRWLAQIENIARQISRKKAAVAYFSERV
ncbi:hypothetical protein LU631_12230 [Erwinia tracheiphila]|uniref:DUF1627 domain-containing protein n=1 Tax=Erwinia tracheiphila TaxID=65700 RepID=A0A0M2KEK1_9GAMM|nr:hypothetical protein [Erwinia tracheiphila]EOS92902.1 hypothetical protein ETR_22009 [Erwinia tracheiphila PSU-1]KKF35653.1 hypothetical protein SY86_09780 [Erwinia tracheiphila]UIA89827.1 hypothetical protein LU631_12230 [Erwinia tracheiphila]UIA98129.1 hypothetical protein LU633_10435 [Erwinia tracheiphila]